VKGKPRTQLRTWHALYEALRNRLDATRIITWLMNLERLREYRLTLELEQEDGDENSIEDEVTRNPGWARSFGQLEEWDHRKLPSSF